MKVVILSAALILAPMLLLSGPQERWRVDGSRLNGHLQTLRRLVTEASGEASRIAFSDADRTARSYVINLMRTAGLETHIDPAGNIIGRREGRASDLPPLMLGSHIDSVPNGGLYDGPLGVMAAIEVAHILYEHKYVTRHPLEIVVFQNEEGGKTGSRLLSGEVMDKEFDLVTSSGKTIRGGIRYIGGDPERLEQVRRQSGEIAAYLELHIEQGAVLESKNISIGVVEGIVGIKRWNVSVEGFANHAGTTPMDKRQDALLAAARFIEAVNKIVTETPGRQVGTVGRIQAFPGAPNVIPGKVSLSLELRDLDMGKIDRLFRQIASAGQNIAQGTGTSFNFDHFYTSRAALTHTRIRQLISEAAAGLGLSAMPMPSGAGHDAQSIAQFAPIGMIFIPSVDGISHSPKEFSRPQDINDGANVLLYTTLAVDAAFE